MIYIILYVECIAECISVIIILSIFLHIRPQLAENWEAKKQDMESEKTH